jgi:hypothetical protein
MSVARPTEGIVHRNRVGLNLVTGGWGNFGFRLMVRVSG